MFSPESFGKVVTSHLRHILGPVVVVFGLLGLLLVPLAIWGKDPIVMYTVLVLLVLVLLFFLAMYLYYSINDRDRLQSETHVQAMTALAGSSGQAKDAAAKIRDVQELTRKLSAGTSDQETLVTDAVAAAIEKN
jgi:uncharacterized membrane protein YeiB